MEALKRFARVSGSFAVVFEEGKPVKVAGRPRPQDHTFLMELAEEVVRAFASGKSGLVLVSPERVRVAYRERAWGPDGPTARGRRCKMVALLPNTDGVPKTRLSDRALEGLIRRHGAYVHPRLVEEGWVDLEDLEALGHVEVLEVQPLPGEKVFVPSRAGWVVLEVA